jgi:hypothetical protein
VVTPCGRPGSSAGAAAAAELAAHGVTPTPEPFRIPTGRAFEIVDPWGNTIGFTDYTFQPHLARLISVRTSAAGRGANARRAGTAPPPGRAGSISTGAGRSSTAVRTRHVSGDIQTSMTVFESHARLVPSPAA